MRRGATLMELVVVAGVFFAVLAALGMIYGTTVNVQHKLSLKLDVDREIFAAVRHLDGALKTSRLVEPSEWTNPEPVESIQLKPLKRGADGEPAINTKGFPQWGDPYTIGFEAGELVKVDGDDRRRLANLGERGHVEFLRPNQGTLQMKVKVEKEGFREEKSARELTFQFRLFNQ